MAELFSLVIFFTTRKMDCMDEKPTSPRVASFKIPPAISGPRPVPSRRLAVYFQALGALPDPTLPIFWAVKTNPHLLPNS
ncbi:MAG: hypothetical protein ACYDC3_13785 [Candidatus Binataceae bacterium]